MLKKKKKALSKIWCDLLMCSDDLCEMLTKLRQNPKEQENQFLKRVEHVFYSLGELREYIKETIENC